MISEARDWIGTCVAGKVWWYRLPLLLILAWILTGYLDDPTAGSIFNGMNLGFHEMGHAAFMWFGNRILTTAGGTIFELGIPVVAGAYLLVKQRDPFGAAVCLFWIGTALVSSGAYAADARAQVLPLVSPFGPVDADSHDWTVMLMKYGKLSKDEAIGGALQQAGMIAMTLSLILSAGIVGIMAQTGASGGAREDANEESRFQAFVKEDARE
ncbi:MAG: hypothetical protein ACKVIN_01340 [Longimicrobiales bacterium]|jgi:hypothetical protein